MNLMKSKRYQKRVMIQKPYDQRADVGGECKESQVENAAEI